MNRRRFLMGLGAGVGAGVLPLRLGNPMGALAATRRLSSSGTTPTAHPETLIPCAYSMTGIVQDGDPAHAYLVGEQHCVTEVGINLRSGYTITAMWMPRFQLAARAQGRRGGALCVNWFSAADHYGVDFFADQIEVFVMTAGTRTALGAAPVTIAPGSGDGDGFCFGLVLDLDAADNPRITVYNTDPPGVVRLLSVIDPRRSFPQGPGVNHITAAGASAVWSTVVGQLGIQPIVAT